TRYEQHSSGIDLLNKLGSYIVQYCKIPSFLNFGSLGLTPARTDYSLARGCSSRDISPASPGPLPPPRERRLLIRSTSSRPGPGGGWPDSQALAPAAIRDLATSSNVVRLMSNGPGACARGAVTRARTSPPVRAARSRPPQYCHLRGRGNPWPRLASVRAVSR